jgi:CheY-like chemotaxis protein
VVSLSAVSMPEQKPRSVLMVEDEVQSQISVDLLFTDVRMPGSMDGIRLANFLREILLQLKVIVASAASRRSMRSFADPMS